MKDNKMVKYPLILGLVALFAGLLLALVYNITSPIIEENKIKRENEVIIEMFGDDVKIEDISATLKDAEKSAGITSALKTIDSGKTYYVYKVTFADEFDGDESSYVMAVDSNGKVYKFKFTLSADDWAGKYDKTAYINSIIGKTSLNDNDIVSGASGTGKALIKSVNAAIVHKGRVD